MADPEAASTPDLSPASPSSDRTRSDSSQATGAPEATGFLVPPAEGTATGMGGAADRTVDGARTTGAVEALGLPNAGSSIGPYLLVRKIGEGGMGAVWEAKHLHLDKPVALKILPSKLLDRPEAVARFYREMKAAGRVTHPNVVQAYDAGEAGGIHYLAMELVSGSDLHRHVAKRGPFTVRETAKAVRQAALGLAAAHAEGLVHRDVKPMNLLVSKDGKVKLLDLGLARLAEDAAEEASKSGLTAAGMVMGTPDYMAPEQWEDTHSAGPAADLYALGCTLFFLLTGRAPFATERHTSAVRKMTAHVSEAPPDLAAARSDVPPELADLYLQLLAKNPADRPASALEVAERLGPFASRAAAETSSGPTTVRPATSPTQGSNVATTVGPLDTTGSLGLGLARAPAAANAVPPRRGARFWSLVGTGGLLPLLLFGTIFFLQTPKGTIRVEVADSDVEVRVKGETVAVDGPNEKELTFSVGEHALVVQRGDFIFETDKFLLRKGKTVAIKVERVDGVLRAVADGKEIGREAPSRTDALSSKSAGTDGSGWHRWPADAPAPAIAPFDAEQAKKHQEAWAKYLKVPVEFTDPYGIRFRLIPPGEYFRGIDEAEASRLQIAYEEYRQSGGLDMLNFAREQPGMVVTLTQPRYVAAHEVTQAQYQRVVGTNPSAHSLEGQEKGKVSGLDTSNFPVEQVSWNDCVSFCNAASLQNELTCCYDVARTVANSKEEGYRLLTDAEWEYACRAGTTSRYWFGDSFAGASDHVWHKGNSGNCVHPVGEKFPNAFGLFDMCGNVGEKVHDRMRFPFDLYPIDPVIEPDFVSPSVSRGGNFFHEEFLLRCAYRSSGPLDERWSINGFRVSVSIRGARKLLAADARSSERPVAAGASALGGESSVASRHEWPEDAPPPAIAPFDAEQAKKHQEAWAKYLGVPVEWENSIGMRFRLIPPGEFMMGMKTEEAKATATFFADDNYLSSIPLNSCPPHRIRLTAPFYMAACEVTQAQYAAVAQANPSHFSAKGKGALAVDNKKTDSHPVESVSYNDAVTFADALTSAEQPATPESGSVQNAEQHAYRLATEAEWEFACRAGTDTPWCQSSPDQSLTSVAWFNVNSNGSTQPVGQLLANPFGLHDMHGNVCEWCSDWMDPRAYAARAGKVTIDPVGAKLGGARVVRGWDWYFVSAGIQSGLRHSSDPYHMSPYIGFRLALPVDAVRKASDLADPATRNRDASPSPLEESAAEHRPQ